MSNCELCKDKGYIVTSSEGTCMICSCEHGQLIAKLQYQAQRDFADRPPVIMVPTEFGIEVSLE